MSLFITSLNSGSNGNCYYIGNGQEAVLVDAGISCRETEKRMHRLGLSMQNVKAIFISHEHGDHIRGLQSITHKYKLPVYITAPTMRHSRLILGEAILQSFNAHQPVQIGGLSITAFPKLHDASDPHSFVISGSGVTIGVFTDIGMPCENVIRYFKQCHAAFLEANYDEGMLERGRYPYHLKARIRGDKGHLSNEQALQLFKMHRPSFMTHLLLAHLSQDNNNPDLALQLFSMHSDTTNIVVASRHEETAVYQVMANSITKPAVKLKPARRHAVQASLF